MQAILAKYLGPTDYHGGRIKATCSSGSITIPYPHEVREGEPAHRVAAEALRDKLGWSGELIGGGLPNGDYVFVFKGA